MSFLKDLGQNLGQTVTNVAGTVVERSQQLNAQAQLQLSIKKLQIERTRRLQELGRRTYNWYQSGTLATAGTVPADINDICRHLERIDQQLEENQRRLEEARLQAGDTNLGDDDPDAAAPSATTASATTALATLPPPDAANSTTSAPPGSPPYPGG